MHVVDPHLFAIFTGSNTISDIADLLPEGDMSIELLNIVQIQLDIMLHMITKGNYGHDELNHFIDYCLQLSDELEEMKRAASQG